MQRDEYETVVVFTPIDDSVRIYTTYPPHIRRLLAKDSTTVVKQDAESIEVVVPGERFDVIRGFKSKRRELTDKQRVEAGKRLAAARVRKEAENGS